MENQKTIRMLRKEKREMKKTRTFKDLLKVINNCFKDLLPRLNNVEDGRDLRYITYETGELLYVMLLADIMTVGTMSGITESFNTDECIENFKKILGNDKLEELPHHDTINAFLEVLKTKELEKIRRYMIRELIKRRMFDRYKFFDNWLVVVDGTGLYYYKNRHCEHCLTKKHKNKETGEKEVRYYHNVLEAKLVVGKFVFSIGTEFIENEEENVSKQDCETKAFKRLAARLKKEYPKLKVCIMGDSLYASAPVREICRKNNWGYIINFKEGSAPTLWEEYKSILEIELKSGKKCKKEIVIREKGKEEVIREYTWINGVSYKEETINVIELKETIGEKETTFVYISSKKATEKTVHKIADTGRIRWKIENEGFNVQKNCGYNLHHMYSKDYNAIKNHYLIIQLAHMIRQLYEKGIKVPKQIETSIKKESNRLLTSLTSKVITSEELLDIQTAKIQLRIE